MAQSEQLTSQLLLFANQSNNPTLIAHATFEQALNHIAQNQYDQAVPLLQKSIETYKLLGNELKIAQGHKRLAQTYKYQANYTEALELAYSALQIYQTLGEQDDISSMHNNIANIFEAMGHYKKAIQSHQKALHMHRARKNNPGIASALYNLGSIWQSMGDIKVAMTHFQEALILDLQAGDLKYIAYSHNKIGTVYNLLGDKDKSREHINQAIEMFKSIKAPRDTDWAYSALAKLELDSGNLTEAKELITRVIERAVEHGYQSLLIDAYAIATEIALIEKAPSEAVLLAEKGVAQAILNKEKQSLAILQKLRVDAHVLNGSIDKAFLALQQQKVIDDEDFNNSLSDAVAEAKTTTEFMRKEQQVILLEKETALQQANLAQQQFARNAWTFGIASLFTLIFLLYRSYVQRNTNKYLGDLVATRTQEIEQKNKELQQAYSEMEAISLTDKLTGLHNRRFLENQIETDLKQCIRQSKGLLDGKIEHAKNADIVFFMIDMDNFKTVNDKHGHHAGDLVLKQLAKRMQYVFRQSDYIIRWGGEEFVVVAKFIEGKNSPVLAQRMLEMVNTSPFYLAENKMEYQSCSIGYVTFPATLDKINSLPWDNFISMADACLYAAKYSGKNNWIGIQEITDPDLLMKNISAKKLQFWHQQQKVTLTTSLSSLDDIKWDSN